MSTLYQSSKEVPTEVLSARLGQLSDVVSSNRERIDAEFTMRIPAEVDRDADLVMSEAAVRLEALQAECEQLRKDAEAALSGLPDSLPMEPYQTVDRGSPHYKAGWNACRRAMLAALEKLIAAHHEAHRKQGGGYRKAGNCR